MNDEALQVCRRPEASTAAAAGGHDSGHDGGRHEESNPVGTALSVVDYAHLAGEAAVAGGTSARTLGEMAGHLGHEALEVFLGEGTAAQTGMAAASAIAAPLAIAGGTMEMFEGYDQYKEGHKLDGGMTMAQGGLSATSGLFGLAALAGSGGAAVAAPMAAAGAGGLALGRYGDKSVKELGWLHDGQGHAESASDWAGDTGTAADNWVTQHTGSGTLGTIAGLGTTLGASVPQPAWPSAARWPTALVASGTGSSRLSREGG